MKIAYYMHVNMDFDSGVVKKIIDQSNEWHNSGLEVGIFAATNQKQLKDRLYGQKNIRNIEYYKSNSKYSGVQERLKAMYKLSKMILAWKPDIVYMRQETFLPVHLLLLLNARVVVEINTDDISELSGSSRIFKTYYNLTRRIFFKFAKGIIFVTKEISKLDYNKTNSKYTVISNGYNVDSVTSKFKQSDRQNSQISLFFIGHADQNWHGIDKIIYLAEKKPHWIFNIVGSTHSGNVPQNVKFHGKLPFSGYASMLQESTCAIGTLALHRKNMREACPLKVREYLAFSKPVVLGYQDTDFEGEFDYILNIGNYEDNVKDSLGAIEKFVDSWKNRGISDNEMPKIDHKYKESLRISFFKEVASSES